jgi:FMN phosphatase YigB (HAD superfamily)
LGQVFKAVVSSIDLERIKPDPVGYRTALEAMELAADRVAFVGHDAEELAGAAAVGMATIAFNHDPDAKADVFIARFEQLLPLVSPISPQVGRG